MFMKTISSLKTELIHAKSLPKKAKINKSDQKTNFSLSIQNKTWTLVHSSNERNDEVRVLNQLGSIFNVDFMGVMLKLVREMV